MIEIGAIASEKTNLVTGGAVSGASAANAAPDTAAMSFGDFLDMINPLQHIPVVSSVYRAITDETINPVSRIVGDTLYGGVLGLASAGLSALGAIGDEIITANNAGQSASATVVAALSGDDGTPQTTQMASVTPEEPKEPTPTIPPTAGSLLETAQTASAAPEVSPSAASSASAATVLADAGATKGLPLERAKQPYGGVMDSSMLQNAQQNQALALALAGQHSMMQSQHSLRNNRFAAAGAAAASPSETGTTPPPAPAQTPLEPETQAAMQNLIGELQAMKGISQYKNTAQSTPIPGNAVNVTN